MRKGVIPREQLTIFNTCKSVILKDTEKCLNNVPEKNIIHLRQELKNDIPSTTYLTHAIHNVYPAKFIPQVPRFVIKKFNLEGKIILDPFAGSGTTAVESLITRNSNISNDVNPLTKFLIEVKTLKLNPKDYFDYLDRLNFHISSMARHKYLYIPEWGNLSYWYPADILSSLTKIWGYIHNIDEGETNIKNILKVSALYVSRKYSYGEDESPKLFKSKQKIVKMKELVDKFNRLGEELLRTEILDKARQYLDCIVQFNHRMKSEYQRIYSFNESKGQFLLILDNSLEELGQKIPEETIDCIVTSPPYIYAQEYFRSTKIDMYWLDMVDDKFVRRLTKMEIGQKLKPISDLDSLLSKIEPYKNALRTIKKLSENFKTKENISHFEAYFNDMLYFVQLSAKLLAKRGILAIFIGEPKVFGSPINVKDIISEMLAKNCFKLTDTLFDVIKSRPLSRNRLNENPNGILGEWLIIGKKL